MRLVVKKLDVLDLGQLQTLVVEHIDAIEPGLTVLDSGLLLGNATIDIVGADSQGALVLVTTGFTADEEMLMKAVEAYSWCLEYPEAIQRLYPAVDISAARPPRLIFVVERMPDAFHRKIKQLGFSEIDCVEFRHLDVSGTQVAYFDTIARLRRGTGVAEFQPAPIARRVSEPSRREAGERPVEHGDKVVPLVGAPTNTRATSVRLQKMLNTNGHTNGGAPVIDIASRSGAPRIDTPAATAQPMAPRAEVVRIDKSSRVDKPSKRIDIPAPAIERPREEIAPAPTERALETPVGGAPIGRVSVRDAMQAPAPMAAASNVPEQTERRVSFAGIANELLGTQAAPTNGPQTTPTNGRPAVDPVMRAKLEEIVAVAADSLTETNGTIADETLTVPKPVSTAPKSITPPKPIAPAIKPVAPAAEPIAPAPPIAPASKPIAPPPPPIAPAPKPIAPPPQPIPPAPKPIAPAPQPIEHELPPLSQDAKPVTLTLKSTTIAPKPAAPASKFGAPAPKPGAPAPKPGVPAPKLGVPAPKPAAATQIVAAKSATAPPADAKPGATIEAAAQNLPQEFEGLKFPNDGVLTRQWMEFLNQMASGK